MKKGLVTAVAIVSMLAGTTSPAAAAGSGLGTFVGHEHAPDSVLTNPATLCAEFLPAGQFGPLLEHLYTEGTYTTGTPGIVYAGTATADFTSSTASYFASPLGTFSDSTCSTPGSVTGTMEIHDDVGVGSVDCSGGAVLTRTASVIEIVFDGSCTISDGSSTATVSTTVTFTGAIEPCFPLSCPTVHPESGAVVTAEALLEGAYLQS